MLAAIFALFGLVVGSFLNVVILRFGNERSALVGRSACPSCGHLLSWYDLLPVASYLMLRGKCRYCRARISPQYPLVEAVAALLFALIGGAQMPLLQAVLSLGIVSVLLCIFVYDLRYKLIPNVWSWTFVALALILGSQVSYGTQELKIFFLEGPIAALPIVFLWYLSAPFTGRPGAWMGFGDVKLALGMGWLLPWQSALGVPLGLIAVFFAFIIGAFVSVCILLPLPYLLRFWGLPGREQVQGYTMKSEVPFGPFLITSCLMCYFFVMYHMQIPFFI